MKVAFSLVTIIMLGSCAPRVDNLSEAIIPSEVLEEWQLFQDYAPKNLRARPFEIRIVSEDVLTSTGKKVIGLTKHKDRIILLDTRSDMYKKGRTHLVLHELGHLILHREHLETLTPPNESGTPLSFMAMTRKIEDYTLKMYPERLEYYMTELFKLE